MKKRPEVNVSYGDLYKLVLAPSRTMLLLGGNELKVDTHLYKPKSAEALAHAIDDF